MNEYDQKRMMIFAEQLNKLMLLPPSADQGFKIGKLIRDELNRSYRRGYTDGLREGKGYHAE